MKTVAPPLGTAELPTVARELLVRHRARAPRRNPVLAFRDALAATAGDLVVRPLSVFHAYAFNTTRQLGANFEMLASHLTWLEDREADGFAPAAAAAADLSREAKAFQFQLARAFHRRSADGLAPRLDRLAATYDRVFAGLDRALDR